MLSTLLAPRVGQHSGRIAPDHDNLNRSLISVMLSHQVCVVAIISVTRAVVSMMVNASTEAGNVADSVSVNCFLIVCLFVCGFFKSPCSNW